MPSQDPRQPSTSPAQESERDPHVPGRLRDLLGARIEREIFLSTLEAAQYVGRPSREAFIRWCRRHNVPLRRPPGGRTFVVKKGDLDWVLRPR